MLRARWLFERAGFTVRPAPANDIQDPAETPQTRLVLLSRAIQEILAIAYYRAAGYI